MHSNVNTMTTFLVRPARWLALGAILACVTALAAGIEVDPAAVAPETMPIAVDVEAEAAPAAPDIALPGEPMEPNAPVVDFSDDGVVIKFIAFQKESNIRDGLRLLAALCKKNIVPSPQVDGPLTVSRLYNVTFDEALNAILGYGFKYEQDGDFVKVYTMDEYRKIQEDPGRMVCKVVTLYYITASEAAKLVRPVLSTVAQITETTAADDSIAAGGGDSLSGGGGGNKMALYDMLVLFDYPERVERAEAIIREIDVRPKQVLIEATIMSARLTEDMEFGIDWNALEGVNVGGYASLIGGQTQGTPIQTSGFANPGSGLTVGFSSDTIQAIITALEEVTDTTLLANPKVLAVNKQEGSVLIGTKLGYFDQTTQSETSTTQSVSFLNTGTQLVFRPYIGNDGYIRMDIYPKDSDGTIKSNGIPDETTTELRTNVIVKDGQTVVIGGLFRDTIVTSRSQVPLLGSLPFVGVAFRGTKDTASREEVIIMLTPHIIEEPSEVAGDDRADDVRRKVAGAKDSMQMIDRTKLAEEAYAKAAKFYLEGDIDSAVFHLKISLMMRPTYLEALRLRERIIVETNPDDLSRIDSIVQQAIDQQNAAYWRR